MKQELPFASARSIAGWIDRGELSSTEAVSTFLQQIERVNPALNAVVQLTAERALDEAKLADQARSRGDRIGPLHGVPMTIKDSLDTAGVTSTGGTTGRRSFVPERDATVVARLRAAGAILLGKTNTPELTLSYETNNSIYGRTNNPWDLERSPGGSSGGAAAILAAGGSPFDIGSDYGGSIRLPSHCCGTVGLKPTSGRVPRTGHIIPWGGMLDSFQQVGPMARWVEDLELLLPILAGPDGVDPAIVAMPIGSGAAVDLGGLRVCFHIEDGIAAPAPAIGDAVRRAARALEGSVLSVDERRPDGIEETFEIIMALWAADGGAAIKRMLADYGTTDSPLLERAGPALSGAELDALHLRWDRYRSRMLGFFDEADAIVCPVNADPALPHGTSQANMRRFSYTMAHNLTGWPCAVVRGGATEEGLPVGIQIVAAPFREDITLAVATFLEAELGGFEAPPLRA